MTEREYLIRDLVDTGNVSRREAEKIVEGWIKNIMLEVGVAPFQSHEDR